MKQFSFHKVAEKLTMVFSLYLRSCISRNILLVSKESEFLVQ